MRFAYASGSRPLDGFTIKRGIGVGGFGEVYFAVSDAGKEVAIKRIQRNLEIEIRGVSHCLNLKHPNLIGLYDIRYDDEGQGWVVMEYVNGDSLKDVVERNPNGLPEDDSWQWFRGISAGVAYLHDHGIVHRDLKPGNIFLDDEVVKIGDYGLAKFISCSRRSGQTESVGTFHYMAPEIGKGVYGKEIDIYALGIILYEMLTGRVPFEGESSQEIIMKHLTADPDLEAVPLRYRHVIQRALAKDPQDRYRDVKDFLAAAEAAKQGRPPHTPTPVGQPITITDEPYYIGDEDHEGGIYFGPLREHVVAEVVPEGEPIAGAVRSSWRRVSGWWQSANLSTPVKVLLLVGLLFVVMTNAPWIIPAGVFLGALYVVYYGIYSLVRAVRKPSVSANPPDVTRQVQAEAVYPAAARQTPPPHQPVNWQQRARFEISQRTFSECFEELSGSMLMASVVAPIASLLVMWMGGMTINSSVSTLTFFAWLCLTTVVSAWTILGITKTLESREGEQFRRRFVMLLGGLVVGLASFGISDFLGVRMGEQLTLNPPHAVGAIDGLYSAGGSPLLPAFLGYFATIFLTLRWWMQADPLRRSRLSVFSVVSSILIAWIVHLFWPFPQPWGFMLALSTSAAVQLSAPWLSPEDRTRLRQPVHHA